MKNPNSKNKRTLLILSLGVIIFALLIYFVFLNKATLTVEVQPKNAQVTLNNAKQAVNNSGVAKTRLVPGKYTLKIEANGFVPYKATLALKGGTSTSKKISLKTLPNVVALEDNTSLPQFINDQAFYLGDNHQAIFELAAGLNDKNIPSEVAKKPITPDVFSNIDDIIFSPDQQLAIIKQGTDASLYDFNKYDIIHQDMKPFGTSIGSIVWAPDQSRLAYYYAPPATTGTGGQAPSSGERSLIFSDVLNASPQRVADLTGFNNPILHWSKNGDNILIIPRNTDSSTNKVYLFDVYARELKSITDFGDVLDARFVENDQKIIYFTSSNDPKSPIKSDVNLMSPDGKNKENLKVKAYPGQIFIQQNDNEVIFWTYTNGSYQPFWANLQSRDSAQIFFNKPKPFEPSGLYLSKDKKILYLFANTKIYATKYEDNSY